MQHLLNLLAAIALLVWGTHIVRTGVLRLFGDTLRDVIARSVGNRAQQGRRVLTCIELYDDRYGAQASNQSHTLTAPPMPTKKQCHPGWALPTI